MQDEQGQGGANVVQSPPFEVPPSWQLAVEDLRQEGLKTVEEWEKEKNPSAARLVH